MKNTQVLQLPKSLKRSARRIPFKRTFDILFSLTFLILALPLYLLITLLIATTSRGRIFYSQERIGLGGKTFRCYKFRTMYRDADTRLHEILASDPERKKEWEETFKLKKDPRVTPIGVLLRKTSLDELPQFCNVLKGDLSIVGPRPVVQKEIHTYYGPKAYKILSVRPGITGLWQVSGRSDTSYQRRIQLDEQYVDKHSFFFDFKIILKTIPAMIFSRGAY